MKRLCSFALLAAVATAALFAVVPAALRSAPARAVTLIYVGAEDCAPCRAWQSGAEAALRASPEFARLTYRAVKSPALFDLLNDAHWPDDLKMYRARLGPGVPVWLVIADGEIVLRGEGASSWERTVLPKVRSLLR